jgi:hypothetical protein
LYAKWLRDICYNLVVDVELFGKFFGGYPFDSGVHYRVGYLPVVNYAVTDRTSRRANIRKELESYLRKGMILQEKTVMALPRHSKTWDWTSVGSG